MSETTSTGTRAFPSPEEIADWFEANKGRVRPVTGCYWRNRSSKDFSCCGLTAAFFLVEPDVSVDDIVDVDRLAMIAEAFPGISRMLLKSFAIGFDADRLAEYSGEAYYWRLAGHRTRELLIARGLMTVEK